MCGLYTHTRLSDVLSGARTSRKGGGGLAKSLTAFELISTRSHASPATSKAVTEHSLHTGELLSWFSHWCHSPGNIFFLSLSLSWRHSRALWNRPSIKVVRSSAIPVCYYCMQIMSYYDFMNWQKEGINRRNANGIISWTELNHKGGGQCFFERENTRPPRVSTQRR